jgi:predicted nucleic acid-binding Zn ribbon protein
MDEPVAASGRFPENLKIKHGPAELLGRFFLWADSAAQERGVKLYFASLQDLVAANKANADSWRLLIPIFDPVLGGIRPETGFVLIGCDKDGQIVATQAARLYEWSESSLEDEATSLRMFYVDPEAAFARGDRCEVAAPVAKKISGRVVFSGAGWYRRDFRGKGLAGILPRVSRAYAFTRWNSDFTISMMSDAVVAGGMAERCGYTKVESSCVELVASLRGAVRYALVWMGSDELLADLAAIMDQAPVPLIEPGLAEAANR